MNLLFIKSAYFKKKTIIFYILIFLLINLSLIGLNIVNYYVKSQITIIKNKVENREIYVKINDYPDVEYIIKKNIEKKYKYFSPYFTTLNNLYIIKINPGITETIPKIVLGRNLKIQKEEIVLPDIIMTDTGKKSTKSLYNKYINIKIIDDNIEKECKLKVVGLYRFQGFNDAYISQKVIENNFKQTKEEYIFIAKKNLDVNKIVKQLSDKNIANLYNESTQNELNVYNNIKNYIQPIFILFLILDIFVISLIMNDIIKSTQLDIGLLKVVGYNSKKIMYNLSLGLLFIFLFPLLVSTTFISIIIAFLFKLQYINLLVIIMKITVINIILIFVNCFLYIKKIKKISLIELLRDC